MICISFIFIITQFWLDSFLPLPLTSILLSTMLIFVLLDAFFFFKNVCSLLIMTGETSQVICPKFESNNKSCSSTIRKKKVPWCCSIIHPTSSHGTIQQNLIGGDHFCLKIESLYFIQVCILFSFNLLTTTFLTFGHEIDVTFVVPTMFVLVSIFRNYYYYHQRYYYYYYYHKMYYLSRLL
jgi:hypothetical protein